MKPIPMDYPPKIKKQTNKTKNTHWNHISETNKIISKSFL